MSSYVFFVIGVIDYALIAATLLYCRCHCRRLMPFYAMRCRYCHYAIYAIFAARTCLRLPLSHDAPLRRFRVIFASFAAAAYARYAEYITPRRRYAFLRDIIDGCFLLQHISLTLFTLVMRLSSCAMPFFA